MRLEAHERQLAEAEQNDLALLKSWVLDAESWEAKVRTRERNGMTVLQVAGVLLAGVLGASVLSTAWGLIIGIVAGVITALSSLMNVWGRVYLISQERILHRKAQIVRDLSSKATRSDILGKFTVDWDTGNIRANVVETAVGNGADDLFAKVSPEVETI